jgi:acetoin utilization protein AcuB
MSKAEPTIQKFMTTMPFSIEADRSIQKAEQLMSKQQIRHLPVMQNGKIIGLISDRDIKLASGIEGVDPATLPVIDACHENPYSVEPDMLLSQVAATMAEKHYGSAIVVQNGKLVGIFTTVDACRALSDILNTRFHTH